MSEDIDQHIISKYKIIKKIGSGAYGHVWKVSDRKTKGLKALKKNFDAFTNSTDAQRIYREIMFLQQLKHPNIITLQKIIKANNDKDIYLVFEHMDIDLHTLIRQGNILQEKHKKYVIYQIVKAIYYLHNSDIIHRDLKPSNVLVNEDCDAKLCDFGLVRLLQEPDDHQIAIMTDYIATRWYRAPQLLLGSHHYSKQIDIWSLGCMIGEIMKGKPLFPGNSTINQLEKVLAWTGPPSSKQLKSLKTNINQNILDLLTSKKKSSKSEMIHEMSHNPIFMDFISKMLEFDPSKRIKIQDIIKHEYLQEFYKSYEIQQLKKTQVNLKLHINDNTKLSMKDYRTIIYKEIEKKNCLDRLRIQSTDIEIQPIKKTSETIRKMKTQTSKGPQSQMKNYSRYPVLKQSKIVGNKRSSVKERSVSRKKGISLCSKEIQNNRRNENTKYNRSFIGTISSSNDHYRCFANKDSSLSKKHTINQTRKKMSYDKCIANYTKLKD